MGIFLGTGSSDLYPLFEFEVDGKKSEITPDNEEEKEEEKDKQEQQGEEDGDNKPEGQSSGTDEPDRSDITSDDEYNIGTDGKEGQETDTDGEDNQADTDKPDRSDITSDDEYTLGDGEGDENGEEGTDDGSPRFGQGETSDDEYNINSDEGGSDEENSEGGDDNEESDDSSSEEGPEDKLKQLEAELFDTLSDEQKAIKIDELKNCYHQLYSRCDSLIGMINDSTAPDENSSRVLEYVNDNLSDLKQYIYDYFTNTFDTKSYMENDAQYQKYIAILNSFNTILEELIKVRDEDNS